ncbi:restriction endonuclease subunit S [Microvirga massiliensis]|uniref:restriction endonuclease subunit S n=1 Tax=Microvirga massiliensis TaxID=1033741 RepID=UPI00069A4A13|nr:restriction endonuclease subunit S [Microvirga massiliensis]
MNSEPVLVKLGDVVDLLTGFPFNSESYTDDQSAPRLLRGDNIAQGALRWNGVKRWPTEWAHQHQRYWLQSGDIVIAMDRPWIEAGLKYAIVRPEDTPSLLVQRVARLRAREDLDQTYLRYVIGSRTFTDYILSVQTGTAVPHISGTQIKDYSFLLPPLQQQQAIASILGALDDKIDLNRRMNETLAAMAQAVFRDWFVDFGPIRAKREGRPPYLSPELWSLFPDHLNDENCPTGWSTKPWREIASLEYGKRLDGYQASSGDVPVYGTNGLIGWHNQALCPEAGVIIGRKGAYRGVHFSDKPFYVIDTAFYLKPKSEISRRWAYYSISEYDINSMDSGSAIPSTSREDFYRIEVLCPPSEIQRRFDETLAPLWERQRASNVESETLSKMLNLLVPKLVSGEIRVKDAEKIVEAA